MTLVKILKRSGPLPFLIVFVMIQDCRSATWMTGWVRRLNCSFFVYRRPTGFVCVKPVITYGFLLHQFCPAMQGRWCNCVLRFTTVETRDHGNSDSSSDWSVSGLFQERNLEYNMQIWGNWVLRFTTVEIRDYRNIDGSSDWSDWSVSGRFEERNLEYNM